MAWTGALCLLFELIAAGRQRPTDCIGAKRIKTSIVPEHSDDLFVSNPSPTNRKVVEWPAPEDGKMIPPYLDRILFLEEQNTDRRAEGVYVFLDGSGQIGLPVQIDFLVIFGFGYQKLARLGVNSLAVYVSLGRTIDP